MKCICKLRVDELRKSLCIAQQTVLGINLPDLSPVLDLAASASADVAAEASAAVSIDASIVAEANLSESESATVSAAAQLSTTANLQATLQAELGVDMTSSSAPKALGGIIHAAQVSGLIDVLQMAANFEGLNPLAAVANAIGSTLTDFGQNLLEGKIVEDLLKDFEDGEIYIPGRYGRKRIPVRLPKKLRSISGDQQGKNSNEQGKDVTEQNKEEHPKILTREELEKKPPEDLPGMIGDSIRKLNDYIKENPDANRVSLADSIIDSLGSSLLIGLDDIDLNNLIFKAIQSAKRDFASDLLEDDGSEEDNTSTEDEGNKDSETNKESTDKTDDENSGTDDENTDKDDESSETDDKTLNESEDEKITSFPDLLEVVKGMIQYDLRGRNSWDQKAAAQMALEKLKELEKLREEKIKEYSEAREQNETGVEANNTEEGTNTETEEEEASTEEETDNNVAQVANKSEVIENTPETEEELLLKIIKQSSDAARIAITSSVLASNSAIGTTNEAASVLQDALKNPNISPDTINFLKEFSDISIAATLKASEASANALKFTKLTMDYVKAGDLEKAIEARELAKKYAYEAKAAKLKAEKARQGVARLKKAIELAEKKAEQESSNSEKVDSPEERRRIVEEAIDSADRSAVKAFGGSISSPTGLSYTAKAVASININGPALSMINASLSTEMLLKAMSKLAIFLSLKDIFGDNLLGPTGGASIAASIAMAASAAASAGAAAGAGAGAGGGIGGGIGGGASAGASAGAGAGASAGASASASAAIDCMSGLLADSPPSPMAILLLIAIINMLRALGHDVVEKTPCPLSLEAIAGNDASKYYENFLEALGDVAEFSEIDNSELNNLDNQDGANTDESNSLDEDNEEDSEHNNGDETNSDDDDEGDSEPTADENSGQSDDEESTESNDSKLSAVGSAFKEIPQTGSWFQSARRSSPKSDLGVGLGMGNAGVSDTSSSDNQSDLDPDSSDSNLDPSDIFASDLSDSDSSENSDSSNSGSWFQRARRSSPKSDLEEESDSDSSDANLNISNLSGSNLSVSGSSDSDLSMSSLSDSDSPDSESSASNLSASSDSGSDSGKDVEDTGANDTKKYSQSDDTDTSGSGDSTDDGTGGVAEPSGNSSVDEETGKSPLRGKVAVGVAAGAVGAAGIGAVAAAMALRNKGDSDGAGDLCSGSGEGVDSGSSSDGDGYSNSDDANRLSSGGDSTASDTTGNAGSGSGVTGMAFSAGSKGDGGDGPWHQRAKRNDPSKNVSEQIYAVGDPTAKSKREENEEESETDQSNFEEIEGGNTWHHRAKHDNSTELRPERLDEPSVKDTDIPSNLDDLEKSS